MQPSGGRLWRFKYRVDGRDEAGAPKRIEKKLGLGTSPAWVTDITYIRTLEGFAYLADVFDYVEMFYNPVRKQVRNGMLSRLEFERQQILKAQGV